MIVSVLKLYGWRKTQQGTANPALSSWAVLATLPGFVCVIATSGKAGAYLVLKFRLPAMRVDALAVSSAPPMPLMR